MRAHRLFASLRSSSLLCASLGAALIAAATSAAAAPANIVVPEEPLGKALIDLALQLDITIATPVEGFGAARSGALSGPMGAREALDRLLSASGYRYEEVAPNTFRIARAPAAPLPAPPPAAPWRLDGVIVTATKSATLLKNAPPSADIIKGDRLGGASANDAESLAAEVAGMTATNLGSGRNKIMLRGLSDGAFSGLTQSMVAVYLGEARITYRAPDPDLKLIDVADVEVLRGPQGVLYGAGSMGGVVRIVPNAPDFERYSGFISVGVDQVAEGGIGGTAQGVVNTPFAQNRASLRIAAYHDFSPGWLDNSVLGLRDANAATRDGGRATLAFALPGGWTLTANTTYQAIYAKDSQYTLAGGEEAQRSAAIREPHDNDFALLSFTAHGGAPWGEITTSTSFLRHDIQSRFDATDAYPALGAGAAPTAFDDNVLTQTVLHETRLLHENGHFPWLVGFYASFGENRREDTITANIGQQNALALYAEHRIDTIAEAALFGQGTWRIAKRLDATFGVRLFTSHLDVRSQAQVSSPAVDVFRGQRATFDAAPQISLHYRFSDEVSLFAAAAKGYRSPGFNTGGLGEAFSGGQQPFRTYAGDRLWNFELGARFSLLDGRFHMRPTIFWESWRNVQTDQLRADNFLFTGNAGDARDIGLETEADLALTDTLNIRGMAAISDPELAKASPTFPAQREAGLPGAPRTSASLGLSKSWRLGAIAPSIDVRALYIGPSRATFDNSATTPIGNYTTLDISGRIEFGAWALALTAENALNARGETFSYGNPIKFGTAEIFTPLHPRTIGLSASRSF